MEANVSYGNEIINEGSCKTAALRAFLRGRGVEGGGANRVNVRWAGGALARDKYE